MVPPFSAWTYAEKWRKGDVTKPGAPASYAR